MRGAERDVVLEALGLAETSERDEFPTESPIQGAALADGWYVVVFDHYGHALLNEDTLRRVSERGEVVAGMAEEHVMCSFSCGWQHGQGVWLAMHDAQAGIRHLEVEGKMPRGFDQIRDHLLSQQDAEGGSEPDVDYVYDVPLDTAKLVSGFSWSETETRRGFHGSAPHRVTRPPARVVGVPLSSRPGHSRHRHYRHEDTVSALTQAFCDGNGGRGPPLEDAQQEAVDCVH